VIEQPTELMDLWLQTVAAFLRRIAPRGETQRRIFGAEDAPREYGPHNLGPPGTGEPPGSPPGTSLPDPGSAGPFVPPHTPPGTSLPDPNTGNPHGPPNENPTTGLPDPNTGNPAGTRPTTSLPNPGTGNPGSGNENPTTSLPGPGTGNPAGHGPSTSLPLPAGGTAVVGGMDAAGAGAYALLASTAISVAIGGAIAAGSSGQYGAQQLPTPTGFSDEFGNKVVDRYWSITDGSIWTETTFGQLRTTSGGSILFNVVQPATGGASAIVRAPDLTLGHKIWIRADATLQNGYFAQIGDIGGSVMGLLIYKVVAGVPTLILTSPAASFSDGDLFGFRGDGTTLSAQVNGFGIPGAIVVDATFASGYTAIGADNPVAGFGTFTAFTV